jgi:GGDEF domain-containing protein
MAVHANARVDIPEDPSERLLVFENFCNVTVAEQPDTRNAMRAILDFVVQATGALGAAVALPDGDWLVISTATSGCKYPSGHRFELSEIAGRAYLERKTYLGNSTIDPRTDPSRSYARIGTTIFSPIMHGRRAFGVLLTTYPASHGTHAKEALAMDEFASVAGTVLGNALYAKDTGIGTRREYERALNDQFDLYRRFGVPFTAALLEGEGIENGLSAAMRRTDMAFELDDATFAVVLPGCSERDGRQAVKRITDALPRGISTANAAPQRGENLRSFQARLRQQLLATELPMTPREEPTSIWERFKTRSAR